MYILHVEDEPSDAALVERYVRTKAQYEYQNVTTIEDAWEEVPNQPDIVLVDIVIGHARKGFGFVHELRKQGFKKSIVAVTALALEEETRQCYESGCDAVLIKPFSINQLIDILEKYVP